jgi:23S rRNA (uracil1939-C5)-methyltransferase
VPRCTHFGECGGCQHQDLAYEAQVEQKRAALEALFAQHWSAGIPVAPSPVIWHYRNKMDPTFGTKFYDEPPPKGFEREMLLGFKRKGRWFHPIDLCECHIGPEGLGELAQAVLQWARAARLKPFNTRNKQGFLKNLVVRDGKRTGERMAVLVTREGDFDAEGFVAAVHRVWPGASVHHAVAMGNNEAAFAETTATLAGGDTIDERLDVPDGDATRDLVFRLSPFSFFQTNTLGAELLYGHIRRWVTACAPPTLYDLYGGSGGIALACADRVGEVVSVESVDAATRDGRFNAERNGAGNVRFHTQAVEDFLRDLRDGAGMADGAAVVVDPPRPGLHPKARRRLLELAPERVLYVSCKPEVLAGEELPALTDRYSIVEMQAFDLFPHTRHVEVVAELRRK